MNPELREMLGKAAYQAAIEENGPGVEWWDELSDHTKENYRSMACAIALALAEVALPALQSLAFAFTGKQIELHFEDNT